MKFKMPDKVIFKASNQCEITWDRHHKLVLTWYLHQPESHQLSLKKYRTYWPDKNGDAIYEEPLRRLRCPVF